MFVVHTHHGRGPFHRHARSSPTAISRPSLLFIFFIGIILLATMALLPPMLQSLFGYPVVTVGMVLAPRGIGTMISMMVGRPPGAPGRSAHPRRHRPRADRLFALRDDLFLARDDLLAGRLDRRHPGLRPRLRVHPADDDRLRHARPAAPHRRDQPLQPRPQSRLERSAYRSWRRCWPRTSRPTTPRSSRTSRRSTTTSRRPESSRPCSRPRPARSRRRSSTA